MRCGVSWIPKTSPQDLNAGNGRQTPNNTWRDGENGFGQSKAEVIHLVNLFCSRISDHGNRKIVSYVTGRSFFSLVAGRPPKASLLDGVRVSLAFRVFHGCG